MNLDHHPERKIADLEDRLTKCRETAEFWEAQARRFEKELLADTPKGMLNQAMCGVLYWGEHHELCKVPEHATKVHPECDCGLSDFLVGNGLINFAQVYLGIVLKHLDYGATTRNLKALADELDAARRENRPVNLEVAERLGPEMKKQVEELHPRKP